MINLFLPYQNSPYTSGLKHDRTIFSLLKVSMFGKNCQLGAWGPMCLLPLWYIQSLLIIHGVGDAPYLITMIDFCLTTFLSMRQFYRYFIIIMLFCNAQYYE